MESEERKCDECGYFETTLYSLGNKDRCYDCHMSARSWDVDPAYAGETYWDE